jgi:hypothetical protein
MRLWKYTGLALALAAAIACGKSEAEKQAEQAAADAQKAAEAIKKAADSTGAAAGAGAAAGVAAAAQGMEAFAKAMQSAATATGADGKPVEPVRFQDLMTALPASGSGWEMDKPTGERMTMPVAFSQAEASYRNGDAEIEVKIVDSAFSQLLIAPWAMFLTSGYSKESSDGYEKSVNVGGNPGFEKWNSESKDGELNLVVAKRFLVTIDGNNIGDPKVLHEFAGRVDGGKLAGLK